MVGAITHYNFTDEKAARKVQGCIQGHTVRVCRTQAVCRQSLHFLPITLFYFRQSVIHSIPFGPNANDG